MTFTVNTHEDEKRQLTVDITVDEERVGEQMQRTARRLAQEVRIPGFRKGKAPYRVILTYFSEDGIRAEAAEEMLDGLIAEALEQANIIPFRQPVLEELKLNPMRFTLRMPLAPAFQLADYRHLRKELTPVTITDEAIEEVLEHLRSHHAKTEPVNRPAEMGDQVVVTGKGYLGDDEEDVIFNEDRFELTLGENAVFSGTALAENLVGLSVGDEKSFTLSFPETDEVEDRRGKSAEFSLTILDVQRRTLPPLDDELAKLEGPYTTLEALRAAVAGDLQRQAETQHQNDLLESMVKHLTETIEDLRYPPVLVDEELDKSVANLKRQVIRQGWKWEDYLRESDKSEKDVRDDLEDATVAQLERQLVLGQFARREKLTVDESDLMARVEKSVARYADNPELQDNLRKYYLGESARSSVINDVLMQKIYDRIAAIYSGTAPELSEAVRDQAAAEDSAESEDPAASAETA